MDKVEQGGHVTELLPALALGCLDEEESAAVMRHLGTCPMCRADLAEYREVVDHLALAVPQVEPPDTLKQRILAQVEVDQGAREAGGAQEVHLSWWQRLSTLFRQGAPAWGVAALALAILLIVSNIWWWQRDGQRASSNGMSVVAMRGTDAAPDGTGTLVISEDGEYGTLVVDGLPVLDAAHTYQLWLIRDGERTSGGVFTVNDEGYGALVVSSPQPLSSYPAFGVTVEPAGGNLGPTGERVLGAGL